MAGLSREVAEHDDSGSNRHRIDKAAKAARDRVKFVGVPSIEMGAVAPRGRDGVSKAPTAGFSFSITKSGDAREEKDAKAYTRRALARSRELSRVKITRERNGASVTDYMRRRHGIESVVFSTPPWFQPTIARIGASERKHLELELLTHVHKITTDHGRPMHGGGSHWDTEVQHFHVHLEKIGSKARALRVGNWTVGADRIQRKFPTLLTEFKRTRLAGNLSKRRVEDCLDLKVTRAIDDFLETWIKERGGLQAKYEEDCKAYEDSKAKKQRVEHTQPLVQSALAHYALAGVWPLAYGIMTLSMWRLVPSELRKPVMLSIRAFQLIRRPTLTGAVSLAAAALMGPKHNDLPDYHYHVTGTAPGPRK